MGSYKNFESIDLFGPQYEIPLSEISSLQLRHSEDFKNRLALLYVMMQEMNKKQTMSELFKVAIEYVGKVLQVDRASISYVNEEEQTLTLTALYGIVAGNPKDITLPLKASATGHSYLNDAISYRPQLDNCSCPVVQKLYAGGLNSTMVAPIISGNIRFGTLNTANKQLDGYSNDDIHLLAQITAILATHIHNTVLREETMQKKELLLKKNSELELFSHLDPLTQLYNRRYINKIFTHEFLQMKRHPRELSVIIADIDYFKELNDRLGHLVGDSVLCELSKLLRKHLRASDILARWGGEEFLIACINTGENEAYILAEKLRGVIEKCHSDNIENITLSFGVTSFVENDLLDGMINRADTALYKAKEAGRNRVTLLKG